MTAGMRERVVLFGSRPRLAGILSTPRDPNEHAPCVVLANAGVIHRVGPGRLYVDIARSLVAHGYSVLRFDLSGLGDSDATTGSGSLTDSAVADIRAALDFLESSRKGAKFIVGGLCAGANYALLTAFADQRVVGAIVIEPTVVRTWRSTFINIGRRLRRPATWARLLTLRHAVWHRSLRGVKSLIPSQLSQFLDAHQSLARSGRRRAAAVGPGNSRVL